MPRKILSLGKQLRTHRNRASTAESTRTLALSSTLLFWGRAGRTPTTLRFFILFIISTVTL